MELNTAADDRSYSKASDASRNGHERTPAGVRVEKTPPDTDHFP
jgi:hypothetical protein